MAGVLARFGASGTFTSAVRFSVGGAFRFEVDAFKVRVEAMAGVFPNALSAAISAVFSGVVSAEILGKTENQNTECPHQNLSSSSHSPRRLSCRFKQLAPPMDSQTKFTEMAS